MRWIRNQLVHETNSFQNNLVNIEDIAWLKTFRSRIMEGTDPFSLLYQSRNIKRKTTKQKILPENDFKINEPSVNWNLVVGVIILIVIIMFAMILINLIF